MASAAEAEVGGLFINGQTACPLRTTLEELGHPQPATIIVTDNACAKGIADDTVKQKRSKAIDMRFYWIRDRVDQKQFTILWKRGTENLADYFTKHHPASHHQRVRSRYLQQEHQANYTTTNIDTSEWVLVEPKRKRKVEQQLTMRHDENNCEGVLKNEGSVQGTNNYFPQLTHLPHFSSSSPQHAGLFASPCSQARLTYWPLPASNGRTETVVSSS
jgi:hypothetical protein